MKVASQEDRVSSLFIVPLIQFLVGILLFVALLFRQEPLVLFCLLILGVAMGAKAWSWFSLSGITWDSTVDKQKVFPEESLCLQVRAKNAKFLPVWLRMTLPVRRGLSPSTKAHFLSRETGLLWYQQARFTWPLTAKKRGVHQVGPPRLEAGDLLGFFTREKKAKQTLEVVVYPRLIPLKRLSLPRKDLFGIPGGKSPVTDPVHILGTRDYQQCQPARFIHWKASARHHRLQEKVFDPSEQEKILLVVEVDQFEAYNQPEAFEHTLEAAASMAVQFHQRRCALGFATNGRVDKGASIVPMGRSPGVLASILEILARINMHPGKGLTQVFGHDLEIPWGTSCICFSYHAAHAIPVIKPYILDRKIPVTFISCTPPPHTEGNQAGWRTYTLEDIRIQPPETP